MFDPGPVPRTATGTRRRVSTTNLPVTPPGLARSTCDRLAVVETCWICGRRCRNSPCPRCGGPFTRIAESNGHHETTVDVEASDPGALDAFSWFVEAEGGEVVAVRAVVRWPAAVLSSDRWEDRVDRWWWSSRDRTGRERLEARAEVLTARAMNLLRRWLGQPAPRPPADDRWRDTELAWLTLTGEPVEGEPSELARLVKPWRPAGSSVRECAVCGASLEGRRPDARTCSPRCRQRLRRHGTASDDAP